MAAKMRRVNLLGAFEIAPELEAPVKDGLILGSRRDHRGFVLETSRDNIEQIVAASAPHPEGLPLRLTLAVGGTLEALGAELQRVELIPMPAEQPEESFVQGKLVFRGPRGRLMRLSMTATEALQIAVSRRLPIMAASDLLKLDVSQFLSEIDTYREEAQEDAQEFKSFVDNVTASDFAKYLRDHEDP